jgi:hypothetical protein
MSDELPDESSDLADDVTQDSLPSHVQIVGRTDFKPWHRTHKQYIREHQWNSAITRLIKQLRSKPEQTPATLDGPDVTTEVDLVEGEPAPVGRRIRCFTLPGEDLLDLQCAWHAITTENCSMQFLGFNSDLQNHRSEANSGVSEAALNMRDRVYKESTVKGYQFQDIASENSKAWAEFRKYGPYDWVNLDLCDTLVPSTNGDLTRRTYSALTQMLKYQVANRTQPWLMFITTQVDLEVTDQVGMCKLVSPTIDNMRDNNGFAQIIGERLPSVLSFNEPACDVSKLSPDQLVNTFGVLLGKWLCKVLFSGQPQCSIRLLSTYRYVINQEKDVHMLSMSFWMKPLVAPPTDVTGLSQGTSSPQAMPTELELAMGLLRQTETVLDVDAILGADQVLRKALVESQADLLAGSGYDRGEYLNWLTEQE